MYMLTITHDGDAVADLRDLLHTVRNVDDPDAFGLQTADDGKQLLDLHARQRRCRLVHDKHLDIMRQCLCDLDHLLLCNWNGAGQRMRIDLHLHIFQDLLRLSMHLLFPKQTAFLLHVIDENVFSNIQIRDQIELLIDDPNALVLHGDRIKFRDLLAGNIQLAAVRYIRARKYLHQRRLAGSVFAHQHMYFSGTEVKTHVFKRFHAGKYLADMTHFDHIRVRSGLLHLASHTQSFLFCFSVPAEADTDFLF